MDDIKEVLRKSRDRDVDSSLAEAVDSLIDEGFNVEFGKIGNHTTYALLTKPAQDIEIVGYTFIKDMKFYKEKVGKLKALQQAIARKEIAQNS